MFKHIHHIKKYALYAPRWMGENVFFGFLILFFVALILSSGVFYTYVFLARNTDLKIEFTEIKFQEQAFLRVLQVWEERETRFQEAGIQPARNIFEESAFESQKAFPEE
jgi:hypothetical protein